MNKTYVCIDGIKIPKSINIDDKRKEYLKQINNPYKVDCGGLTVSISFEGTDTLEKKILNYLKKT